MHELVRPHEWVALRLPNEALKLLQVIPNTTVFIGKYGSFPSNLIIGRPFHITFEVQDKLEGETFFRIRPVPASEIHAEVLAEEEEKEAETRTDGHIIDPSSYADVEADEKPRSSSRREVKIESEVPTPNLVAVQDGGDYALVDQASGNVLARTGRDVIEAEAEARQLLTHVDIEELKKGGNASGRDIIAKLMLSHTGIDQKTAFSRAKYKILKNKKYLRRFTVLPLNPAIMGQYLLGEKDASRVLEIRQEMLDLLASWSNVRFASQPTGIKLTRTVAADGRPAVDSEELGTRWLVVDDTGGLIVATVAERIGILHPDRQPTDSDAKAAKESDDTQGATSVAHSAPVDTENGDIKPHIQAESQETSCQDDASNPPTKATSPPAMGAPVNGSHNGSGHGHRRDDMAVDLACTNTITVLHTALQPNLSLLRYWDYDSALVPSSMAWHPLSKHLHTLSWLQLLDPESDSTYSTPPLEADEATIQSWKSGRRGNYHRKRRRWARTRFVVDQARAGNFSGLIIAADMDPVSILRHTLPLLAGGAPIAIYSPNVEPLSNLADCFSLARRSAWTSTPPAETEGWTAAELERWQGDDDFPLNPTLLLGCAIQTSRAKRWQVLPGRTHPLMTSRGGAEGYLFTAWKAVPAEGKVEARGKFKRRKADA